MLAERVGERRDGVLLAACLAAPVDGCVQQAVCGGPGSGQPCQVCVCSGRELAGGAAEGVFAGLRGVIAQPFRLVREALERLRGGAGVPGELGSDDRCL